MSLNTCYFSNFYQKYQLWDRVMFYLSLYPKCYFVTCSDFDQKKNQILCRARQPSARWPDVAREVILSGSRVSQNFLLLQANSNIHT